MGPEYADKSIPKTAFVFPGQGAQFVGMGQELYNESRIARELFEEIDDILNIHLTRTILDGPETELAKTINSQPAIMATSLACLKVTCDLNESISLQPQLLAGHSLGEYTSLVVSGVLGLAEGMRLVRERGRLMQEASDKRLGGMAAILGLHEEIVADICNQTKTEIANINGADQIVISGDKSSVSNAADMASVSGAKRAVLLTVAGAFHSSLMSPAQDGLNTAIDQVSFKDPLIPIIANSTSNPMTTANQVKEELRVQLCKCVQWKKSVEHMIDTGTNSFIEFGPGKVLTGLIKRIAAGHQYSDKQVRVINVSDMSSAMKTAELFA